MKKIDQILDSLYDRVIEPMEAKEQLLDLFAVMPSLLDDVVRSKEQNEQMNEVDIILKAQKVLQTFKMEMNVNTTTEQHHNAKLPVMPRFIPQPSDLEELMKEKLEARKINDEFGWTGEWRMSAKDVLDVIIDLQNGA